MSNMSSTSQNQSINPVPTISPSSPTQPPPAEPTTDPIHPDHPTGTDQHDDPAPPDGGSATAPESPEHCVTPPPADASHHDKRSSLNLDLHPMNVIIVTDTDATPVAVPNRTKKFYESDDTFIQSIFSQTITSTTVTPTDDDYSYSFETNVNNADVNGKPTAPIVQPDAISTCSSISLNGEIDVDLDEDTGVRHFQLGPGPGETDLLLTPTNQINDLSQHTDNLDGYAEAMISFSDVLGLDRDPDDRGGGEPLSTDDVVHDDGSDWDGPKDGDAMGGYFDRTIVDDDDEQGVGDVELDENGGAGDEEEEEQEEDEEEVEYEGSENGDHAVELLESSTTTMSSDQQVLATSTTTSSTKTTTKKVVKKKKTIATALSTETMVVGAGEESLLEALASSSSIKTTTNGHVQHQESIEECQVNGGSTTAKVKKIVKKKATSSSSTTSSTLTTSTSKEGADLMVESVATEHQDDQYQADQQSADAVKPLKKKTKKTKKSDAEKENISVCTLNDDAIVSPTAQASQKHLSAPANVAGGPTVADDTRLPATAVQTHVPHTKHSATSRLYAKAPSTHNLPRKTATNGNAKDTERVAAAVVDTPAPRRIVPSGMQMYEDDLSNINVKSLSKLYLGTKVGGAAAVPAATADTSAVGTPSTSPSRARDKEAVSERRYAIGKDVSVKHLCRSFGDLSALHDHHLEYHSDGGRLRSSASASNASSNQNLFSRKLNGSSGDEAKLDKHQLLSASGKTSLLHKRAKSVGDLRKLEQLPIQTGVSVRALRDSYCNLVGMYEASASLAAHASTATLPPQASSSYSKYSRVKFGIKQFDMKSSFSKFDALQKKNILHVRSSDAGKAQEKFNGVAAEPEKNCRACHKPVFKMEEVKAERNIWHRTCFKCTECAKQLNVDTYESHESILYCKPHFRTLFTPKAVEETEPVKPRKHELIIRENQPMELPPDVVRSCDKTDLGLEELHQLNVKSRFQVFEHGQHETTTTTTTTSAEDLRAKGVKRSASILSKLAKFQSRDPNADGPSDAEEEAPEDDESDIECEEGEDIDLIRAKRAQRERPLSFANMSEVKSRFESGAELTKEERREERKQELQNIRSRLFMGKQAKIKEMYQQAVLESEQGVRAVDRKADAVMADMGDKARSIKDRFEKGQVYRGEEDDGDVNAPAPHQVEEDAAVFEQGLGKQSRSLFMEMDANAARTPTNHTQPQTPTPRSREPRTRLPQSQSFFEDVVKAADRTEDVRIETADISNKFKFFEMYKPTSGEKKQFRITPPREGVVKLPSPDRDDADVASDVYYDPDVVRGGGGDEQQQQAMLQNSHTTTKMLSMFRQMEDARDTQQAYDGLKPLKRFTPPPDNNRRLRTGNSESENDCTDSEEEEEMDEEEEEELQQQHAENGQYVRASDKNVDEFLLQAQSAARAKQLRAKFERWESKEIMREKDASSVLLYGEPGDDQSQVESAKEIRAKFESMRNQPAFAEVREKIKVNRFL